MTHTYRTYVVGFNVIFLLTRLAFSDLAANEEAVFL